MQHINEYLNGQRTNMRIEKSTNCICVMWSLNPTHTCTCLMFQCTVTLRQCCFVMLPQSVVRVCYTHTHTFFPAATLFSHLSIQTPSVNIESFIFFGVHLKFMSSWLLCSMVIVFVHCIFHCKFSCWHSARFPYRVERHAGDSIIFILRSQNGNAWINMFVCLLVCLLACLSVYVGDVCHINCKE